MKSLRLFLRRLQSCTRRACRQPYMSVRPIVVLVLLAAPAFANATTVTLDAVGSGWVQSDNQQNASIDNYIAGRLYGANEYRNWFAFDLSGVTETIISAQLQIYNPAFFNENGFDSNDPSETYSVYGYDADLTALTTTGTAEFADLGAGSAFGSVTMSGADNGSVITITLNAAGISALNSAAGEYAVTGAVNTLNTTSVYTEHVFGFTDGGDSRQLVINVVPIPAAVWLFGSALAGLGWLRRKPAS